MVGTIGLYAAGYHEAAAGDMRIVGMAGVQRGIVVDVVYPAPGKIMARKEDPISWKMSGVGIVPGEEMELRSSLTASRTPSTRSAFLTMLSTGTLMVAWT